MAWRKQLSEGGKSGALEIYSTGQGLVIQGDMSDVTAYIDEIVEVTRSSGGRHRHLLVDGAQVAANAVAYRQTHREYFEFSARAMSLIKEHGLISAKDGYFRSFVRDGRHFAGNLDWKSVDLSPEQALSLQAVAGQMALRAAIKDVVAAIERVEGKVDQLVALARAERLGSAHADRATLQPLVDRLQSTGELSNTDWATIASLGPLIARDIESLRSYIVIQLKEVGDSTLVRNRASDAEELADKLVRESFALLVVVEANYALWQQLRLGHASLHEPSALGAVTNDVRRQLAALTQADQDLLSRLSGVVAQLVKPTGWEGLAPLKKRKLKEHAEDLADLSTWFGDQRHLDHDTESLPEYAALSDSLSKAGKTISSKIRSLRDGEHVAASRAELGAAEPIDVDALPTEEGS